MVQNYKKFKWKASIKLIYEDIYPGKLLGTTYVNDVNIDKILFNNLIITNWGYDYLLKVTLKSIPDYYLAEKTLGPFNVWPKNETQFNRITLSNWDSKQISITLAYSENKTMKSVDLIKMDLFLINYFGRVLTKIRWKNMFTHVVSDKLIANAIISGSKENLLSAKIDSLMFINSTFNLDNQSFIIVDIAVDFDSVIIKSAQKQNEDQEKKVSDNETNSLPIAWITAIIINALLVFLFILFVIYCYYRSKKSESFVNYLFIIS